jgi:hypothetical protein
MESTLEQHIGTVSNHDTSGTTAREATPRIDGSCVASGAIRTRHVGLDGKAVATADKIADFTPAWSWVKDTKDGEDATLKIDAAGKRTLNVWMREDGFVIDRILLTTDKTFTPTGNGP